MIGFFFISMLSEFMHVVAYISTLLLFCCQIIFHCMTRQHFVYSSVDEHFCGSHFLPIMNVSSEHSCTIFCVNVFFKLSLVYTKE